MSATGALSAAATGPEPSPLRTESTRTVLLPGSPATYANRAVLREMGLGWDPAEHRWHGTTTAEAVKTLHVQPHLEVRVFAVLEWEPKGPAAPKLAPLRPAPLPTTVLSASRDSAPWLKDGCQTHLKPRVALPTLGDEPGELTIAARTFGLREISGGLPDESREEDEREETRPLRACEVA